LSRQGTGRATAPDDVFSPGVDDVVIVPLIAIAFAVRRTLRAAFTVLVDIVDFAFPILLQVMRFPLFTLRIVGDGIAALLKAIVRILPVGGARRDAWREIVGQYWTWLRKKFSYKAFEEALHHAFENGMAWVFRTCRTLTPRAALLVLAGAVLWFPVSFVVATLMHAVLIAKALSLPAWMQLLHPVATVIAKTKLLVLPVYPAAWPQARLHPLVQATIRLWHRIASLRLVRKIGYRYRQTENVVVALVDAASQTKVGIALGWSCTAVLAGINGAAVWVRLSTWTAMTAAVDVLSKAPLVGALVQRYTAHYDHANRVPAEKFSKRARDFFERWSVKFTAEYYEAKEQRDAASGRAEV
jgi:hypothetical protein